MTTPKPFAESAAQNQEIILSSIQSYLKDKKTVLEIGSGTGQHAVYFSKAMPHLTWQCSDLSANHEGINAWIKDSTRNNILAPITLDVSQSDWGDKKYDVIYLSLIHI